MKITSTILATRLYQFQQALKTGNVHAIKSAQRNLVKALSYNKQMETLVPKMFNEDLVVAYLKYLDEAEPIAEKAAELSMVPAID